jgi:hypothetical protein
MSLHNDFKSNTSDTVGNLTALARTEDELLKSLVNTTALEDVYAKLISLTGIFDCTDIVGSELV